MKNRAYILSSPDFPGKIDFEKFPVWCEWHEPEEIDYMRSLCSTDEEYNSLIEAPYEAGKTVYYPIIDKDRLPNRVFLEISVKVHITSEITLPGYLSIIEGEAVAVSFWMHQASTEEMTYYRSDRLVAEDENPETLHKLKEYFGTPEITHIKYSSNIICADGKLLTGSI